VEVGLPLMVALLNESGPYETGPKVRYFPEVTIIFVVEAEARGCPITDTLFAGPGHMKGQEDRRQFASLDPAKGPAVSAGVPLSPLLRQGPPSHPALAAHGEFLPHPASPAPAVPPSARPTTYWTRHGRIDFIEAWILSASGSNYLDSPQGHRPLKANLGAHAPNSRDTNDAYRPNPTSFLETASRREKNAGRTAEPSIRFPVSTIAPVKIRPSSD